MEAEGLPGSVARRRRLLDGRRPSNPGVAAASLPQRVAFNVYITLCYSVKICCTINIRIGTLCHCASASVQAPRESAFGGVEREAHEEDGRGGEEVADGLPALEAAYSDGVRPGAEVATRNLRQNKEEEKFRYGGESGDGIGDSGT
jgi:hypothetical protein